MASNRVVTYLKALTLTKDNRQQFGIEAVKPEKPTASTLPETKFERENVYISIELEKILKQEEALALFQWKGDRKKPPSDYWESVWADSTSNDLLACTHSWKKIKIALRDLENAIVNQMNDKSEKKVGDCILTAVRAYNQDAQNWTFELLNRPGLKTVLKETIPIIIDHAIALEQLLAQPISLLKSGNDGCIYITQQLVCSLLANAFFCAFRERTKALLPQINFFSLFGEKSESDAVIKVEKVKCFLNYFKRIFEGGHDGVISYERRVLKSNFNWGSSKQRLSGVNVTSTGTIELATDMLQVVFANIMIGGGILDSGMVMEGIRFCISPELIVARLFTSQMGNNEVLVITGCEQFNKYSGYASSFKYDGNFVDNQKKDSLGRLITEIVAIDAMDFRHDQRSQYNMEMVDRELNKCYCAFRTDNRNSVDANKYSQIATGNWGCGVYEGDPQLKFLIQWLAASEQQRIMKYFTFGDQQQWESLVEIINVAKSKNVGQLYEIISKYKQNIGNDDIFEFVLSSVNSNKKGN